MEEIITLSKSPLFDVFFEIKFNSPLEIELLLSSFYNEIIKIWFSNYKKLSINELPESMINDNPNLKYQPRYSFEKEWYILYLWTSFISLWVNNNIADNKYKWWINFFEEIKWIINLLKIDNFKITEFNRIWMRYTNFFENINIFDKDKIIINIDKWDENINNQKNLLQTVFIKDNCNLLLNVSNNANIQDSEKWTDRKWSIIDLDVSILNISISDNDIENKIKIGHNYLKETFFWIFKEEYLLTLR